MKITLISGSVAKKSHTQALLLYLESLLRENKIESVFWELKTRPLPVLMPEFHSNPIDTPNDSVKEFVRLVDSSDGIILGTPLYHGSYSGVLKNALDNLGSDSFRNKAIGLVGNGSTVRSPQALEHLRSVVRTLYGYPTQTQVATMKADYKEEEEKYVLTDKDIKERCQRLVKELINLTKLYKEDPPNKKG